MRRSITTLNLTKLAQGLFFLNAAIWLLFGLSSLLRISSDNPTQVLTLWIIAILKFGNVVAMLVCGIGIGTPHKLFYYLALFVLVVNIILTVTDEFGFFDFSTLLIDIVLFILLIVTRNRFAQPAEGDTR